MKLIIDEFIEELKKKQASANTVASYERDISQFCDYFEKKSKKIFDLNKDDMSEYIEQMKINNKSNSTISRMVASIKAFYKYLLSKKLVEENITNGADIPKVNRKDPIVLTTKEIEKLLEQPNLNDLKGQRDKAMLELLYVTGMRVTELISLKVDDINISNLYVKVKKKNTERQIPIGIYATRCMKNYINEVRPLLIKTEQEKSLFINANGQKMTRQGFWKILKQYKEEANIDKDLTPHTLRHSFAVHLVQKGTDIRTVQQILGHTDIASTMLYAQMENINKDDYGDINPNVL